MIFGLDGAIEVLALQCFVLQIEEVSFLNGTMSDKPKHVFSGGDLNRFYMIINLRICCDHSKITSNIVLILQTFFFFFCVSIVRTTKCRIRQYGKGIGNEDPKLFPPKWRNLVH